MDFFIICPQTVSSSFQFIKWNIFVSIIYYKKKFVLDDENAEQMKIRSRSFTISTLLLDSIHITFNYEADFDQHLLFYKFPQFF